MSGGAAVLLPRLRELVLSRSVIQEGELERVVAGNPRLRTVVLVMNCGVPERVRLRSGSLWCVVFWQSVVEELAVVSAPLLERIILQTSALPCGIGREGSRMRIKITAASALRALGYLNPNHHQLQIGDTVIKVGKQVVPDAVVPSVKVLALSVQFGVRSEASRAVFRFLECFPNIETLHVLVVEWRCTYNGGNTDTIGTLDVECVKESITKVVIHGFRWENCEIEFLKAILEGGKVLQKIYIIQAKNISVSEGDINGSMSLLASQSKGVALMILAGQNGIWTYEMASDLSRNDPFDFLG
ncbi:hypothetical protein HU200_036434 [Digitaria exilis]|uniref:FBD domain-containing protein n=1 Tax=Digitaria exilis TaxID=1010633 RepID=A0A835BEQ2_9POAL|nr:hypothetical protein HU200_036434 [Digitaria exilis]